MPHYQALTNEAAEADVRATYEWLRSNSHVNADAISCVGFCMGGRVSFLANSVVPVRKAVSFYGGGIAPGLLDRAAKLHGAGAADVGRIRISTSRREHRKAVVDALSAEHKVYVNVEFSHADHGFFCDERAAYEPHRGAAGLGIDLGVFALVRKLGNFLGGGLLSCSWHGGHRADGRCGCRTRADILRRLSIRMCCRFCRITARVAIGRAKSRRCRW